MSQGGALWVKSATTVSGRLGLDQRHILCGSWCGCGCRSTGAQNEYSYDNQTEYQHSRFGLMIFFIDFPFISNFRVLDGGILIFFRLERRYLLIGGFLTFDAQISHGGIQLFFRKVLNFLTCLLLDLLYLRLTHLYGTGSSSDEHCTTNDHSSAHSTAHAAMPAYHHHSSWTSTGASSRPTSSWTTYSSSSHNRSPFMAFIY